MEGKPSLILASASPRRAQILRDAGIPFEVVARHVDETVVPGESAEAMVLRLAEAKARAAAGSLPANERGIFVLGADTTVVADDGATILGKPSSPADAARMLRLLSGRTHRVLTGIAAIRLPGGEFRSAVESTLVTFAEFGADEIARAIASGEPFDKAGAYAIQGRAGRFVERVDGCYFNVVGLPLHLACKLLGELGWSAEPASSSG
ncbi:MAG: Maf family protein [Candidatus Acidiferrales bacterium]